MKKRLADQQARLCPDCSRDHDPPPRRGEMTVVFIFGGPCVDCDSIHDAPWVREEHARRMAPVLARLIARQILEAR